MCLTHPCCVTGELLDKISVIKPYRLTDGPSRYSPPLSLTFPLHSFSLSPLFLSLPPSHSLSFSASHSLFLSFFFFHSLSLCLSVDNEFCVNMKPQWCECLLAPVQTVLCRGGAFVCRVVCVCVSGASACGESVVCVCVQGAGVGGLEAVF